MKRLAISVLAACTISTGEEPPPDAPVDAAVEGTTQRVYLKASNTDPNDGFGSALAISGNSLVIGAPGEASDSRGLDQIQTNNPVPGAGAAYVFMGGAGSWAQTTYMKAPISSAGNGFGAAVAVDGNMVVIGAPGVDNHAGAAYVFVHGSNGWYQQNGLAAPVPVAEAQFGSSVAVSPNWIVVGATGEANGTGAVYVYDRRGFYQATLIPFSPQDPGDAFGSAITIGGTPLEPFIFVGAPGEDSNGSGSDDNSVPDAGAVYQFSLRGSWGETFYAKADTAKPSARFGRALAFSESTLAVGAPGEDAAYVFAPQQLSNAWGQQARLTGVGGSFGSSISLMGDRLAVGAPGEDNGAGAARMYSRSGASWVPADRRVASNRDPMDRLGSESALAVYGDIVVAGAPAESSSARGIGGDGASNAAPRSGAVYIYVP